MEKESDFERYDRKNERRKSLAGWLGLIGVAGITAAAVSFFAGLSPYIGGAGLLTGIVCTGAGWSMLDMKSGPSIPDGKPEDGWF